MKAALVLGTRPEIIKLSPVIRRLVSKGVPFSIIHTNQHYIPEMDRVFFEQLALPAPDYNLGIGSATHGVQIGRMLEALDPLLGGMKPDVVVVQGDTNSVLAGALMAHRLMIPVAHVESGLRSYDRRMPEETNRILADRLSDYLFAPTDGARKILLDEGFEPGKIRVTGNTIVDALFQALELCSQRPPVERSWPVKTGAYALVTLHRPENVDSRETLENILDGLDEFGRLHALNLVFPVHPRTAERLREFRMELPATFLRLGAIDFLSFIQLQRSARLVVTDSGGVQEEACILGVPCVTVRLSTERPETVLAGANLVAGTEKHSIVRAAEKMLGRSPDWENPFGDGRAGERIVDAILG